ncbi:MAG: phenylalanine--tRNA ligase subunit alpha, partial [Alphaproteobacteria bacterium]|nr:phenylalanine--tRNA ligase subunit alpha [Alphaproteobacteria bacterium]
MADSDPKIEQLRTATETAIASADSERALEEVRVAALGKKGSISALLATLGKMDAEQRRTMGPAFNELKKHVAALIEAKAQTLGAIAL